MHKLPKDMLLKLIEHVEDPKGMSDDYLQERMTALDKEMNMRKTIKVKEYLLRNEKYTSHINVIKDISYIRLSYGKCLVYVMIFFGPKNPDGTFNKISSFLYSDILPMGSLYSLRIDKSTILSECSTRDPQISLDPSESSLSSSFFDFNKCLPYKEFVRFLGNDISLINEVSEYLYHRSESSFFD